MHLEEARRSPTPADAAPNFVVGNRLLIPSGHKGRQLLGLLALSSEPLLKAYVQDVLA